MVQSLDSVSRISICLSAGPWTHGIRLLTFDILESKVTCGNIGQENSERQLLIVLSLEANLQTMQHLFLELFTGREGHTLSIVRVEFQKPSCQGIRWSFASRLSRIALGAGLIAQQSLEGSFQIGSTQLVRLCHANRSKKMVNDLEVVGSRLKQHGGLMIRRTIVWVQHTGKAIVCQGNVKTRFGGLLGVLASVSRQIAHAYQRKIARAHEL